MNDRARRYVPFMAPRSIDYFVGRAKELSQLHDALQRNKVIAIHGLYGMAGVGKTALCIRFAHEFRNLFPDGVLWAQLDKLSTMDILYAFAQAYDQGAEIMSLSQTEQRIAFVQLLLSNKHVLVVLDNALTDKSVEPLLRATVSCPVIVTTRYSNLATLRDAIPIDVEPLSAGEALELLEEILGREQVNREQTAAKQICNLTGYLPLALRIIAQRAKRSNYQLATLVARLEKRRLDVLGYGLERTKDTDVRISFDISYEDLHSNERIFFASLGVFGGVDFDVNAAAYVATTDIMSAENLLEELYGLSLVQASKTGRWRLHALLTDYAREKLTDRTRYNRMLDFFISLAERAEPELHGAQQAEWLSRLETEHSNLRAAIQWSKVSGEAKIGLRLAGALWWFWAVHGYLDEGRQFLSALLAEGADADASIRAKALNGIGMLAADQGDFATASSLFGESLALRPALIQPSDRITIAESLTYLGYIGWCQGRYGEARPLVNEGLELWQASGVKHGIAFALNTLGLVASYQGAYSEARSLFEESLGLRREVGDKWGIASSLNNLGEVIRCQEEDKQAVALYNESLGLRREVGDKWGIVNVLNNLGEVIRHQGNYGQAATIFKEALTVGSELGNKMAIATSLAGFAGLAVAEGQPVRAARLFGSVEKILTVIGSWLSPANQADYTYFKTAAQNALNDEEFTKAWTDGNTTTMEQAVTFALEHFHSL